jgi:hypothetical protein
MPDDCVHVPPESEFPAPGRGCEICLEIGSTWHHLRQCLTCFRTLCCDDSPNRHMSAHNAQVGHPVMRSAERDDEWAWCYVDQLMLRQIEGGWESFDGFVETGFFYAERHLGRGGTLEVDDGFATVEGFPLGQWIGYVRDEQEAGTLRERDRVGIEGLPGWHW